eukprot:TRINITY_DN54531_c0_g1_i1.p1 TRINITY_DN54531_c0_g1~~TRINITY_DN54531_c0_g1_i1.p1  ORF type:complete len:437 (+),score=103.61 TRINITY_DN54531_c0_g1_i1:39-1313(+)
MAKAAERVCQKAAEIYGNGAASWNRDVLYNSGVEAWMMAEVQALVLGARKHEQLLKEVAEESGLSSHADAKNADPNLFLILLYQCLLGTRRIRGDGSLFAVVKDWKAQLQKTLAARRDRGDAAKYSEQLALPRYLRVNTLRVSYEEAIAHLASLGWVIDGIPGRWVFSEDPVIPNVLRFPPRSAFHGDALLEKGALIIQDRSSCIPAAALAPPRGAHVIDCCAAPGNKTSHVASLLARTGKLFAFERNPKRCETLQRQMDKFGVEGIKVFCEDFMHVDPNDERFANVTHFLCDPTCSGSGQLANQYAEAEEESRAAGQLSAADLQALAEAQAAIVLHCMSFPAAVAVTYSTCSVHEEENEAVVAAILEKTSKFVAVECLPQWKSRGNLSHGPAGPLCCRASHDVDLTNGFFCARFEKRPKRKRT